MKFDYTLLKNEIEARVETVEEFAKLMQQPLQHINNLLDGTEYWTMKEIDTAVEVLGLDDIQIQPMFFTAA